MDTNNKTYQSDSNWLSKKILRFDSPWGNIIEIDRVEGLLIPGDVQFVYDLAASLPQGGKYLEIGSFMGLSAITAAMSLFENGNQNGSIVCVDTWKGSPDHADMEVIKQGRLYGVFRVNIDRLKVASKISACTGESTKVSEFFEDQSLDIIFVDGDHSYESCLADLRAWYPKLKKGGRFVGHDATPEISEHSGVRNAVMEFARDEQLKLSVVRPPATHYMWEMTD